MICLSLFHSYVLICQDKESQSHKKTFFVTTWGRYDIDYLEGTNMKRLEGGLKTYLQGAWNI